MAEGVGVLPGQGGEEVPPVDGEGVVEEEGQRGGGQRGRAGARAGRTADRTAQAATGRSSEPRTVTSLKAML